jgi:hypothetical protein
MQKLWSFIGTVSRRWGSLVTGGTFIGLLATWQGTGHHVLPSVYWAVATVGLFVAFFRAWKDENREKESALALADSRSKVAWHSEWQQLSNRFSALPKHIRADWQTLQKEELWSVSGLQGRADCESICKLAGAMLLKSPHMAVGLSDKVKAEKNNLRRWLHFLKEVKGISDFQRGSEQHDDGTQSPLYFGRINDLSEVSARVCIECATVEL